MRETKRVKEIKATLRARGFIAAALPSFSTFRVQVAYPGEPWHVSHLMPTFQKDDAAFVELLTRAVANEKRRRDEAQASNSP